MPSVPKPPRRHIEALRACKANPDGLRPDTYPGAMPALAELGYVRQGLTRTSPHEPAWFLTRDGRELVRALGVGEHEDPT